MAVQIRFDNAHNVITPTFVLGTRSGNKLGTIPACNINISDTFGSKFELQFEVNKFNNGEKYALWDKLVDFAIVWCKEWDVWFEIAVTVKDSDGVVKQISCTSIGEAELSQVYLYDIEINTEDDIARDDYVPTHLYDASNHEASLLHRIMDKVPHYSIKYVENRLASIQRTFSFDSKSLYDALQEISEEIDCLFVINSGTNSNGKIERSISVYDLESYCTVCHKRGSFDQVCSECGSTNVLPCYGEDTAILISVDNLADEITYSTDTGSVKNCFRLECGDDLMTATVRNCNPNGSQYIWYISDATKEDMSDELASKLNDYNIQCEYYNSSYTAELPQVPTVEYNNLVLKYDPAHSMYSNIGSLTGYTALTNIYYNTIQFRLYLHDEMMPTVETATLTVQTELAKLSGLALVSVQKLSTASLTTITNAVESVAKTMIDPAFRVVASDASYNSETNVWQGKFTVTSYSDETQTATSASNIQITISDDYGKYVKQRVNDLIKKESKTKELIGIERLFDLEVSMSEFNNEIKKYCLTELKNFHDSCEACVNLLIQQGVADKNTAGNDLYNEIYVPYYNRLLSIQNEIQLRESEITIIESLQSEIGSQRDTIRAALDLESYLGTDLWLEFVSYRREDIYKNENYISDGLKDTELFEYAQEFIKTAKNEIYKSAMRQHVLSASLRNLLVMKEFESITEKFSVGNWIRVKSNDNIYRLRLMSYSIDYNDLGSLSVEFSDVSKVQDGITEAAAILSKASSMSSSYGGVTRQAAKGEKSNQKIDKISSDGLALTNIKIVNDSDNQNIISDKHGMTFREYDEFADKYDDKQLKIINKGLYITDDNWESSKSAIGECQYIDPQSQDMKTAYGVNGEVIVGKLLLGEALGVYNEAGTLTFNENGLNVSGNRNENGVSVISSVVINPNNELIFHIQNGEQIVMSFNKNTGALTVNGNITAQTLTLGNSVTIDASFINGLANVATSGSYNDLDDTPPPVDISGKFDNPANNASATSGQVLVKQVSGSSWETVSGTVADSSTAIVNSQAVYDYALNKNQGAANAGCFLYVDTNGNVVPMTITDVKNALGI